jgi:hypothetical protein
MPTRSRSFSSRLPPALLLLTLTACAATSPAPKLPEGPLAVVVPCSKEDKPQPAPLPAVEAARQSVDFSAELSTLLRDARTLLEPSTQPSSKP